VKKSRVIKVKRILTAKKIKTIEQLSNIAIKLLDRFFRFGKEQKSAVFREKTKPNAP